MAADRCSLAFTVICSAVTQKSEVQDIEHLTADLVGYNIDVAVITKTHLKKKHADHCFCSRRLHSDPS